MEKLIYNLTFFQIIHVEIPALTRLYDFNSFAVFLAFNYRRVVLLGTCTEWRRQRVHLKEKHIRVFQKLDIAI